MTGFRLDRFLTLYFFHPLVRRGGHSKEFRVPILMYHSISDDRENEGHPYYHINTSPAVFAEQMRFISDNDYSVVDLKDLENCFDHNNELAAKCVVITFDDGYRDFYTKAFPILHEYNFPATVFLPTEFIGNKKKKLTGKEHLTWSQVSELSDQGISFGSHTVTHPELISLRDEDLEYEIKQSKETIEEKLGKSIDTFSYPFKFPEDNKTFIINLRNLLQKHGYHTGVSTRIGTTSKGDDIYSMKRIPVNSDDDILFFKAKLEGAYDWLNIPQYLIKRIRTR